MIEAATMTVGTPKNFLDGSRTAFSEEDEAIAELKNTYTTQLLDLKNLIYGWSDADLLFAIDEAGGAVELAFYRITEGHAERWEEAHKKKEKKDKKDFKKKKPSQNFNVNDNKSTRKYSKNSQHPSHTNVKTDDSNNGQQPTITPAKGDTQKNSVITENASPPPHSNQYTHNPRTEFTYKMRGKGGVKKTGVITHTDNPTVVDYNTRKFNKPIVKDQKFTPKPSQDDSSDPHKKQASLNPKLKNSVRSKPLTQTSSKPIISQDINTQPLQSTQPSQNAQSLQNTQPLQNTVVDNEPSPDYKVKLNTSWAQMVKTTLNQPQTTTPTQQSQPSQPCAQNVDKALTYVTKNLSLPNAQPQPCIPPQKQQNEISQHLKEEQKIISPSPSPSIIPSPKLKINKPGLKHSQSVEPTPNIDDVNKQFFKGNNFSKDKSLPQSSPVDALKNDQTRQSVKDTSPVVTTRPPKFVTVPKVIQPPNQQFAIKIEKAIKKSVPSQQRDSEFKMSFTSPQKRFYKKNASPVNSKYNNLTQNDVSSKVSSLSVKFGSVQLNPNNRESEKDKYHIVFPPLNKKSLNFVQNINNEKSDKPAPQQVSDVRHVNDDYPQTQRDELPYRDITSLQGTQSLLKILQCGSSTSEPEFNSQDSSSYKTLNVKPLNKVSISDEKISSFNPIPQSTYNNISQNMGARANPRHAPMSLKHSPEQKPSSLNLNIYPVPKSTIPKTTQTPSSTIPPPLTSTNPQPLMPATSTSVSTQKPSSHSEIVSNTFSNSPIAPQQEASQPLSSTLGAPIQNHGPVVAANVTLPLPFQPLNKTLNNSVHHSSYHVSVPQSHHQQSFVHQQLPHAPCPAPYHYMPFYVPDMTTPYYGFNVGNSLRYHQMYNSQSQRNIIHSGNTPTASPSNKTVLNSSSDQQHDCLEQHTPTSDPLFQPQISHVFPVQNHIYGINPQSYSRDRQLSNYNDINTCPPDLPLVRSTNASDYRISARNYYTNQQQGLHMFGGLHCGGGIIPNSNNHQQSINKTNTSSAPGAGQPSTTIHSDYLSSNASRRHQLYEQNTSHPSTSAPSSQNPISVSNVLINQNQVSTNTGPSTSSISGTSSHSAAISNNRSTYYNQPYDLSNFNHNTSHQDEPPFNNNTPQGGGHRQNSFYAQNRQQSPFWLNTE